MPLKLYDDPKPEPPKSDRVRHWIENICGVILITAIFWFGIASCAR